MSHHKEVSQMTSTSSSVCSTSDDISKLITSKFLSSIPPELRHLLEGEISKLHDIVSDCFVSHLLHNDKNLPSHPETIESDCEFSSVSNVHQRSGLTTSLHSPEPENRDAFFEQNNTTLVSHDCRETKDPTDINASNITSQYISIPQVPRTRGLSTNDVPRDHSSPVHTSMHDDLVMNNNIRRNDLGINGVGHRKLVRDDAVFRLRHNPQQENFERAREKDRRTVKPGLETTTLNMSASSPLVNSPTSSSRFATLNNPLSANFKTEELQSSSLHESANTSGLSLSMLEGVSHIDNAGALGSVAGFPNVNDADMNTEATLDTTHDSAAESTVGSTNDRNLFDDEPNFESSTYLDTDNVVMGSMSPAHKAYQSSTSSVHHHHSYSDVMSGNKSSGCSSYQRKTSSTASIPLPLPEEHISSDSYRLSTTSNNETSINSSVVRPHLPIDSASDISSTGLTSTQSSNRTLEHFSSTTTLATTATMSSSSFGTQSNDNSRSDTRSRAQALSEYHRPAPNTSVLEFLPHALSKAQSQNADMVSSTNMSKTQPILSTASRGSHTLLPGAVVPGIRSPSPNTSTGCATGCSMARSMDLDVSSLTPSISPASFRLHSGYQSGCQSHLQSGNNSEGFDSQQCSQQCSQQGSCRNSPVPTDRLGCINDEQEQDQEHQQVRLESKSTILPSVSEPSNGGEIGENNPFHVPLSGSILNSNASVSATTTPVVSYSMVGVSGVGGGSNISTRPSHRVFHNPSGLSIAPITVNFTNAPPGAALSSTSSIASGASGASIAPSVNSSQVSSIDAPRSMCSGTATPLVAPVMSNLVMHPFSIGNGDGSNVNDQDVDSEKEVFTKNIPEAPLSTLSALPRRSTHSVQSFNPASQVQMELASPAMLRMKAHTHGNAGFMSDLGNDTTLSGFGPFDDSTSSFTSNSTSPSRANSFSMSNITKTVSRCPHCVHCRGGSERPSSALGVSTTFHTSGSGHNSSQASGVKSSTSLNFTISQDFAQQPAPSGSTNIPLHDTVSDEVSLPVTRSRVPSRTGTTGTEVFEDEDEYDLGDTETPGFHQGPRGRAYNSSFAHPFSETADLSPMSSTANTMNKSFDNVVVNTSRKTQNPPRSPHSEQAYNTRHQCPSCTSCTTSHNDQGVVWDNSFSSSNLQMAHLSELDTASTSKVDTNNLRLRTDLYELESGAIESTTDDTHKFSEGRTHRSESTPLSPTSTTSLASTGSMSSFASLTSLSSPRRGAVLLPASHLHGNGSATPSHISSEANPFVESHLYAANGSDSRLSSPTLSKHNSSASSMRHGPNSYHIYYPFYQNGNQILNDDTSSNPSPSRSRSSRHLESASQYALGSTEGQYNIQSPSYNDGVNLQPSQSDVKRELCESCNSSIPLPELSHTQSDTPSGIYHKLPQSQTHSAVPSFSRRRAAILDTDGTIVATAALAARTKVTDYNSSDSSSPSSPPSSAAVATVILPAIDTKNNPVELDEVENAFSSPISQGSQCRSRSKSDASDFSPPNIIMQVIPPNQTQALVPPSGKTQSNINSGYNFHHTTASPQSQLQSVQLSQTQPHNHIHNHNHNHAMYGQTLSPSPSHNCELSIDGVCYADKTMLDLDVHADINKQIEHICSVLGFIIRNNTANSSQSSFAITSAPALGDSLREAVRLASIPQEDPLPLSESFDTDGIPTLPTNTSSVTGVGIRRQSSLGSITPLLTAPVATHVVNGESGENQIPPESDSLSPTSPLNSGVTSSLDLTKPRLLAATSLNHAMVHARNLSDNTVIIDPDYDDATNAPDRDQLRLSPNAHTPLNTREYSFLISVIKAQLDLAAQYQRYNMTLNAESSQDSETEDKLVLASYNGFSTGSEAPLSDLGNIAKSTEKESVEEKDSTELLVDFYNTVIEASIVSFISHYAKYNASLVQSHGMGHPSSSPASFSGSFGSYSSLSSYSSLAPASGASGPTSRGSNQVPSSHRGSVFFPIQPMQYHQCQRGLPAHFMSQLSPSDAELPHLLQEFNRLIGVKTMYSLRTVMEVPRLIRDPLHAMLASSHRWDFDIFAFHRASYGRPLSALLIFILRKHNLFNVLNIPEEKLLNYIYSLESSYLHTPYHNVLHAADVVQATYALITQTQTLCEAEAVYYPYRAIHPFNAIQTMNAPRFGHGNGTNLTDSSFALHSAVEQTTQSFGGDFNSATGSPPSTSGSNVSLSPAQFMPQFRYDESDLFLHQKTDLNNDLCVSQLRHPRCTCQVPGSSSDLSDELVFESTKDVFDAEGSLNLTHGLASLNDCRVTTSQHRFASLDIQRHYTSPQLSKEPCPVRHWRPLLSILTPMDFFAGLLAAAAHDVRHPGANNAFLSKHRSVLSVIYNDSAVLEHYHCSQACALYVNNPRNDFTMNWTLQERDHFRNAFTSTILATDMTRHAKLMNQLQHSLNHSYSNVSSSPAGTNTAGTSPSSLTSTATKKSWFSAHSTDDRLFLLRILVHSADISNPARPFTVAKQWSLSLSHELESMGAYDTYVANKKQWQKRQSRKSKTLRSRAASRAMIQNQSQNSSQGGFLSHDSLRRGSSVGSGSLHRTSDTGVLDSETSGCLTPAVPSAHSFPPSPLETPLRSPSASPMVGPSKNVSLSNGSNATAPLSPVFGGMRQSRLVDSRRGSKHVALGVNGKVLQHLDENSRNNTSDVEEDEDLEPTLLNTLTTANGNSSGIGISSVGMQQKRAILAAESQIAFNTRFVQPLYKILSEVAPSAILGCAYLDRNVQCWEQIITFNKTSQSQSQSQSVRRNQSKQALSDLLSKDRS